MGRGEDPAAGGSQWQRAIAHLAIVVVFVLSALGYAPFREHAATAAHPQEAALPPNPLVARPIDHEAARAALRALSGIRSASWLDEADLAVTVEGESSRSVATVERVCDALASLGDTLALVIHVQAATAAEPDAASTLSRNCQQPEVQLAFLQKKREVDVALPALGSAFKKSPAH